MNFQGVEHSFARHDNLLGLLFNWQASDQSRHLLSGLPLSQLPKTLLACPYARVDDLQKQVARLRVEDEDSTVDGLGCKVTFEGLVDGHAVNVSVVDEPDDLV